MPEKSQIVLTDTQARLLRMRAQGLLRERSKRYSGTRKLVASLVAVQAQYLQSAELALAARNPDLRQRTVEHALYRDEAIVRTWCLRGTLHLVAAEDLGWLLDLTAPRVIASTKRRFHQLGLDDRTTDKAVEVIEKELANQGPLARSELLALLEKRGIDTSGQRGIHLIGRAALLGGIVMGPARGGEAVYSLAGRTRGAATTTRHRRKPPTDSALAELARRYLAAYGPAGPRDLAAWSGLPAGDARKAWKLIAGELCELGVGGQPAWLLSRHRRWLQELIEDLPVVRLLPAFDNYLLAYWDRSLVIDPRLASRINAGGGLLRPIVTIDGHVAATWKLEGPASSQLQLHPFVEFSGLLADQKVQRRLVTEAAGVGRFLDRDIHLAPLP